MRTDKEMLDLIVGMAKRDDRIRAVQMFGSRTNPHAVRDRFQDFDICYYVNEIDTFTQSDGWLNYFGEPLMLRKRGVAGKEGSYYLYEMLLDDGNRIDLALKMTNQFQIDGDTMLLFSKDKFTSQKPEEHNDYNVTPPTKREFNEACQTFWWTVQDVAKGIARDELPYAKHFFDRVMRGELNKMLSWKIGQDNDFKFSTGTRYRFFKQYLEKEDYEAMKKTYSAGEYPQMWDALFAMCELFREISADVAQANGFDYPLQQDENMTAYLLGVEKELPVHPQKPEPVKIKVAKLQREFMPYGKVLVVDDMETNLYVTKGILSLYGLTVDTATSGAQAIDKIAENNRYYDMVFMDHLMPDMDGITAANAILDKGYTGPLVALTANNASGQEEIFISTGFDAFLSKPIDAAQLNALLNKHIRDKQPPEVLAAARAEMVRRADEKRRQREETVNAGLIAVFIHDAEKAINYLKGFDGTDLHNYVIAVHAMKSTLNVMGEEELSELAARLEAAGQAAGGEANGASRNAKLLIRETPGFVSDLREVVEKYKNRK